MEYKKFILAKIHCGTQPYVNSRLEMDIKDIIEYGVISRNEIDDYDIVKVISHSDNKDELLDEMRMLEEADYYLDYL